MTPLRPFPASTEPTTTSTTKAAPAPAPDPWAETAQTRALRTTAVHYRAIARRWWALMRRPMPLIVPPTARFQSLLEKPNTARYCGLI